MMKSAFLFLLGIYALGISNAQDSLQAGNLQTSKFEGAIIEHFPNHFFVWPLFKQRRLDFKVEGEEFKKPLRYKPNNARAIGLGAYIFDVGLEIMFTSQKSEKNEYIFGESKASDFHINLLAPKFGVDIITQKYTGFYIEVPDTYIPPGTPYPQRSDIRARVTGITGLYIFTPHRFSIMSTWNFSERQCRSGGSFLLTSTISAFRVEGDSAIVAPKHQDLMGDGSDFTKMKNTTFSIAPGYAYNLVLLRDFFIGSALMIGPAHNWISYQEEGG